MDTLLQDLRFALRQLRRSPGFTAVAVGTLALAIGVNTAVFSVVDRLLLRPLDYPAPERIVRLLEYQEDGSGRGTISAPNFYDWMEQSTVFEAGALFDEYYPTLRTGGEAIKVEAASVGAAFFDVLGVEPAVGRFFLPQEDEPESSRVVLSWGLWRSFFGADPEIVGRTIDLNGFPYTVVGVAPSMEDPRLSYSVIESPRLWRSTPSYFATNGRGGRSFTAVARLRPEATPERAQAELSAIHARLQRKYPEENAGHAVRVVPLRDDLVGGARPVLWVLLAAVGLVLLIACANVANLLLFRAATRAREMRLRAALGASRGRVVRQLLVESLVLALLGAAGGVAIALGVTRALVMLAAGQLPRVEAVGIDLRVLGFTALAAVAAALIFGLLPALHATRFDLRGTFGGDGRGVGAGRERSRLRTAIVAAQVGLAVVVMLGAGVLARSLLHLRAVDPGISTERVVVLRTDPPADPYDPSQDDGQEALLALYRRLEERLGTLPGVEAVGLTDLLPMSGNFNGLGFSVVGRPEPGPGRGPSAEGRAVSVGYFEAMGIPLLRGRGIESSDRPGSERVVVVNRAFARRHFPRGDALGERIRILDPEAPARIVGVVGDVTQFSLDAAPEPVVYLPVPQAPDWMQDEPWVVLRTRREPGSVLTAARAAIQEIEPRAPVYAAGPMSAVISETLARPRFRTLLLVAFAGVAFLLALAGVYAMVAYATARRRQELGVRVALGADSRRVLVHVVGGGVRPVLLGATVGVLVGLGTVRLLRGFLYGVSASDPLTFLAVPLTLITVAMFAAWIPARRAARLDPMSVLKEE